MRSCVLSLAVLLAACGDDGGEQWDALPEGADAAWVQDAPANRSDAGGDGAVVDGSPVDAFVVDASAPLDASIPDAASPDAAPLLVEHVHIDVSNTCVMTVSPQSYDVLPGQTLRLSYHNHSTDYPVDVWKSYGGGYLDLATGSTWNETYEHCSLTSSYTEYADISTACSSFRLYINCL